jgi:hypothetical protein
VEVETSQPQVVRALLLQQKGVLSVTQLGLRLRAMVDPRLENPVELLEALLERERLRAAVTKTYPTLEDVFVAATQRSGQS